jgi:hypothetical protein
VAAGTRPDLARAKVVVVVHVLATMTDLEGFGTFLVLVVVLFLAARITMSVSEGDPTVVDDGFTTRGGGWVDGKQASWPFVELHVTPDQIELRPATVKFFAPVTITRGDRPTISCPWSPFGRGVRFSGPGIGRRVTFWPARHRAVIEAMRQLSWPVGEAPGPAAEDVHPAVIPVRADHRIGYHCSWLLWLQVPILVGIVAAVLALGPPPVFLMILVLIWGYAAATTAYRIECDGAEVKCFAPIWHRTIPVEDVVTIQGVVGGTLASGSKTTITPRRGPRMWLLVATKQDRANYDWFLDQLAEMAPTITIRR